jgi:hypothetical protein
MYSSNFKELKQSEAIWYFKPAGAITTNVKHHSKNKNNESHNSGF